MPVNKRRTIDLSNGDRSYFRSSILREQLGIQITHRLILVTPTYKEGLVLYRLLIPSEEAHAASSANSAKHFALSQKG